MSRGRRPQTRSRSTVIGAVHLACGASRVDMALRHSEVDGLTTLDVYTEKVKGGFLWS
jgi:hypothetical protein